MFFFFFGSAVQPCEYIHSNSTVHFPYDNRLLKSGSNHTTPQVDIMIGHQAGLLGVLMIAVAAIGCNGQQVRHMSGVHIHSHLRRFGGAAIAVVLIAICRVQSTDQRSRIHIEMCDRYAATDSNEKSDMFRSVLCFTATDFMYA